jgi:glycosyltransferase involved in cell wall biosynthesis
MAERTMRVAIVIEWFDPGHGGAERSTHALARELAERGHEVTVVAGGAPAGGGGTGGGSVLVRCWRGAHKPRTGADAVRFGRWAESMVFSGEFDASLSVTTSVVARVVQPRAGLVIESMARRLASVPNRSERLLRRLGQTLSLRKRALLRLERRTFSDPRVGAFIAISHFMKRQIQAHYAIAEERLEVIPNGADLEPVTAEQRRRLRAEVRRMRGWNEGDRIVLFPAFDARRKGLEPLLRALTAVHHAEPTTRLVVAGAFPAWARRLGRRLGVSSRIDPLGRVRDMRGLYVAADVTALPTWYDPASKVVMESMIMGTPVVTTAANGSSDWIETLGDPGLGRVVADARDVAGLAEAVLSLLRGAPSRNQARERAALMSMKRHVEGLEKVLERSR